jgi:hypothetical protein
MEKIETSVPFNVIWRKKRKNERKFVILVSLLPVATLPIPWIVLLSEKLVGVGFFWMVVAF